MAVFVLIALIFSKYFYIASLSSYYTFYLIGKFHVPVQTAQIYLFVFLGAIAAGTIIGGPVGDRIGRKYVIWCSILGVLPFSRANTMTPAEGHALQHDLVHIAIVPSSNRPRGIPPPQVPK